MNKINKIISTINYALEVGNADNYEVNEEDVDTFLEITSNGYVLVQWPYSQEYMEEDWFDEEAIFCGGSEEKTGSSAYFIPIKYVV